MQLIENAPAQMRLPEKWNPRSLPPEGNPDVGAYVYQLYLDALAERSRLALEDRWKINYRMYRGHHWMDTPGILSGKVKGRLSIALLGTNINRTVANITARAPVAEVQSVDGVQDEDERLLTVKMAEWNNKQEQQELLSDSALNMEIYGITVEKAVYDHKKRTPQVIILDPFSYLPAPGFYKKLNDIPYQFHIQQMDVKEAESMFDVSGLSESPDIGAVLGKDREDEWVHAGTRQGSGNLPGNYVPTKHPDADGQNRGAKVLVLECWIRDYSVETASRVIFGEDGEPVDRVEFERPKYPGYIRKITICNNGHAVLDDCPNPNVNYDLPEQYIQNTYLYDHMPFFKANSYRDTTSLWGFSQAELCGDINLAIDDIWSQIMSYLKMSMFPPLILPKDTKIPLSKVRYLPRLVLQPMSKATGDGIRWLDLPNPPTWLFQALDTLLAFFDRISQIEDADRGEASGGVIAASAIQMLQERGAVLVRAKIRAVDYLVRQRGRCFLSFWQNFGVDIETLKSAEGPIEVSGIDFAARKFDYVVEAGSTVYRTTAQTQEQSLQLYQLKAIDRRALLENLNFPNWKEVVERMAESELAMALDILVQAGLPEIEAQALMAYLSESQGGPGASISEANAPKEGNQPGQMGQMGQRGQMQKDVTAKAGAPAKPGKPKATQGEAR